LFLIALGAQSLCSFVGGDGNDYDSNSLAKSGQHTEKGIPEEYLQNPKKTSESQQNQGKDIGIINT
jgi:hypothetical protein